MSDAMKYVDTLSGSTNINFAKVCLLNLGLPATGDDSTMSLEDLIMNVSSIRVSSSVAANPLAKEMVDSELILQVRAATTAFEQNLTEVVRRVVPAEGIRMKPTMHGDRTAGSPAFLRVSVASTGNNALSFSSGGAGAGASSSAGGASGDSATGVKRQRLGMTDPDLARACTIMDMPAARATPQFLVDKPLDVRMYTPLSM